jgi:hypothetical protein
LGSIYGRRVKDRDGSDPTKAITKFKLRAIDDDVTFKDLVTRCSEAKGKLAIERSRRKKDTARQEVIDSFVVEPCVIVEMKKTTKVFK